MQIEVFCELNLHNKNPPAMSFSPIFSSFSELLPQEETLAIEKKKGKLSIGMPKETCMQEKRVALTPEGVYLLTSHGHEVAIESGAGMGARYTDNEYSEAGAQVLYSAKEVFERDLILKIEPPSQEELDLLTVHQTLISALQLKTRDRDFFRKLSQKKSTAIAIEHIRDERGNLPIQRCMSEIAGNAAILIAAEYLNTTHGGKGYVLGGISGVPPTEIVILGAGTVGLYAARTALGMGAHIKVFDRSISRLKRLQDALPYPIYTCVIQPKILAKALRRCDVLIGAMKPENGRTPIVVTEDLVQNMKARSVIIDVSIDNGGCIETSELTSHEHPVFEKYNIIHYCVPNIPSRVARTASFSLNNIFAPLLLKIGDEGGIDNALKYSPQLRSGMYMYKGLITHRFLGERFDLPYSEGSLLFGDL
jgi:alanine dehydrogenase